MRATYGKQQGDAWVRNRVGRITGSRLADVVSYLKNGKESAKRYDYRMELIAERRSGRAIEHYVTPAMEDGISREDDARIYYERALDVMVEPVSFVLHPQYEFTGSSPDGLVGSDGCLEIKCPTRTEHQEYEINGIPEKYIPQMYWEMICTGRKWCDFVSYNPEFHDKGRFFYRRLERTEDLVAFYTEQVLKFEAEIQFEIAQHEWQTLAPFPVEVLEEKIESDVADESQIDADFDDLERRAHEHQF